MKKIILLSILVILTACGGIETGSKVKIKTDCVGCYSESCLEQLTYHATNKNAAEFDSMVESDSTILLFNGQLGTILQVKDWKVQIRLSSGREVWVLDRHLKEVD